MHDINFIRENPSQFDEGLKKRFLEPQSQIILDLDLKKRELLTKSQDLRSERKNLSSEFSKLNDEEKSSLQKKVQNIKNEIEQFETEISDIDSKLKDLLSTLPNLPHPDVPVGEDEQSNTCLLYTSPSPRDAHESRMPSSA